VGRAGFSGYFVTEGNRLQQVGTRSLEDGITPMWSSELRLQGETG